MKKSMYILVKLLIAISYLKAQDAPVKRWLKDLPMNQFESGMFAPKTNTAFSGSPLKIAGKVYNNGLGARATSALFFHLKGKGIRFKATVGQDDASKPGYPVQFVVVGDRKVIWQSPLMRLKDKEIEIDVDIRGIQKLGLLMTDTLSGVSGAYGDWANALFLLKDTLVAPVKYESQTYILTPAPDKKPKLNSAPIYGATPGSPFLFRLSATGSRPLQFSAKGLPAGLKLNPATGIITGSVKEKGTYLVHTFANNQFGEHHKLLRIRIGDTISLTPPLGWNGWNSWARDIDETKVRASLRAFVEKGLYNHPWTYINIDDCWQGPRGGAFNSIQPNERFPNWTGLIDSVHQLGLKFGLYSTPWISSYAGYTGGSSNEKNGYYGDSIKNNKRNYRFVGNYRFDKNDAQQWAAWGVDYMKYDWRMETHSAALMQQELKASGRDIVYSLSNSAPFEQAADWAKLSNCFRTGGDIKDSWQSLYKSGFTVDRWAPYGGPGHWNDPDMLVIGEVSTGSPVHPTRLTADEQYTHMSLWSLLAAPIIIGCPLERMDDFTVNLFTNDEVLEINQDVLGKSARLLQNKDGYQVWAKPMEDGSWSVGLFNTGNFGETPVSYFIWGDEKSKEVELNFQLLGKLGMYRIRDVWRHKDLGVFQGKFTTTVPNHGVALLRLYPSKK
jgi:alpha-galactosidase